MTIQPIELILIEKGAETSEWADRHERLDAFLSRVRNIPTDEKHTRYILRDADGRILEQHRTIDFFGMRPKASIFVNVEIDWMIRAKEAETELAALKSASASDFHRLSSTCPDGEPHKLRCIRCEIPAISAVPPAPQPAMSERDVNVICGVIVSSLLSFTEKERLCGLVRGLAAPAPSAQIEVVLFVWKCTTCGCLWRDTLDGFVSLFPHHHSCPVCEMNPTKVACEPCALHLIVDEAGKQAAVYPAPSAPQPEKEPKP